MCNANVSPAVLSFQPSSTNSSEVQKTERLEILHMDTEDLAFYVDLESVSHTPSYISFQLSAMSSQLYRLGNAHANQVQPKSVLFTH